MLGSETGIAGPVHAHDHAAGRIEQLLGRAGAAVKIPFIRLSRELRSGIVISQDPVHAFGDLDPGRREIMTVYLEALAHAGSDWRVEECGGCAPHSLGRSTT